MSVNPLVLKKLKDIMGAEAVESMLGAQFDVSSGHEMLAAMVPEDIHKRLHGPVREDFMEEAISCSYCLSKLIQFIYAKHSGNEKMFAIKHKWSQKKLEATR